MWVPANNRDLSVLSLEAVDLIVSLSDVEDFDSLVFAACDEPVAIDGIPSHLVDCVVVRGYVLENFAACTRVPNLDVVILTAGEDQRLGRVPVARPHIRSMIGEDKFLLRSGKVEHDRTSII